MKQVIEKYIYEDKSDLKDFSFYDDEDYLFFFFQKKLLNFQVMTNYYHIMNF